MNNNQGPGIWKWTVLLLILCNIGLILTIWLKPHRGDGHRPETPRDYVIRSLNFTDGQVNKYDELIKDHRKAMNRLRKDAMEYREVLFGSLKNEQGSVNTDSLARLIAENQAQVDIVTYRHFGQVRALCTDAQKTEFDKIITEVIKKMNGGMRGGPPPRNDDGPGPSGEHNEDDSHHPGDTPEP